MKNIKLNKILPPYVIPDLLSFIVSSKVEENFKPSSHAFKDVGVHVLLLLSMFYTAWHAYH